MDFHSLMENRQKGKCVCMRVCVSVCVREAERKRGGGLIDSLSDWGTVKRRPQSDLP